MGINKFFMDNIVHSDLVIFFQKIKNIKRNSIFKKFFYIISTR